MRGMDPAPHLKGESRISVRSRRHRLLTMVGAGGVVVGIVATIVFAVQSSDCGKAVSLGAASSTCNHPHAYVTASYLLLVAGAALVVIGGFVLPTVHLRDERRRGPMP
jgi:hypothetical protein